MSSSSSVEKSELGKAVCVFCGSSPGNEPIYADAARSVGRALAKCKIPLVYGGGRRGIMGIVSQSVLEAGGYSHGVMPRALVERQMGGSVGTSTADSGSIPKSKEGGGEETMEDDDFDGRMTVEVTAGMHERKLQMAKLATGGFIVLPGGYGTFEEALEMITWNQLGIHSLPVIILNINNVYSPLRDLFERSVSAGFIKSENLTLCHIVDLTGGPNANADPSKAEEWGKAAVEALHAWSPIAGAGYGLKWDTAKDVPPAPVASSSKAPMSFCGTPPPLALFTTLRFTSPSQQFATVPIDKSHLPLLDRHVARLREAHAHFRQRDGQHWGDWLGDEEVWQYLRLKLEERETQEQGDWRVRLMLHPGPSLEVHIVPAPSDAGPFTLSFPPHSSLRRRSLILDPQITLLSDEAEDDLDLRRYKTNHRQIYDSASARGGPSHPEVLLRTATHVLETATSNIAIQQPDGRWITPRLTQKEVFLDGVARRELLARGMIEEGEVSLEDWERCQREGWNVIGFNGLRGVWQAELL